MNSSDLIESRPARELTRRGFLRVAGGITSGALALPLLLDACGGTAAPAASTSAGGAPASTGATGSSSAASSGSAAPSTASLYPTYSPLTGGPKPDFPAAGPLYENGYINYPLHPFDAFAGAPAPGKGSTITAYTVNYFPPPTPYAQNGAWKQVNKELNANVQFQIATAADYATRLATIMAGNDLPDIVWFATAPGAASALGASPDLPKFIELTAEDLTPYLSGDNAKNYPMIAALPTNAWKNAGAAFNGKLYLIPRSLYAPGFIFLKNSEAWTKAVGADYVPKSSDDFLRVMKALNDPKAGFYATGSAQGGALGVTYYSSLFGAPNDWRLESDGKLTKNYETPEFKESVGFLQQVWKAGLFHPQTLQYNNGVVARSGFTSGKWAIWLDGFQGAWEDVWRQALHNSSKPFNPLLIPPFAAHAGGKAQFFLGPSQLGAAMFKKASPDRIKEELAVFNWLCAPFGSQQAMLLEYGQAGIDYKVDAKGNPLPTAKGNPDANYVPWKFLAQHHSTLYVPDIPNFAKTLSEAEHILLPIGVTDPIWGLVPGPTASAKGFVITKTFTDGLQDIMVGRRPLSDYDSLLKDWQNNGGNQIRQEYMAQLAKAK